MEEKKSISISISSVFLILSLIVIIVMAYCIYTIKKNDTEKISTLESNANDMQNTINNLQEKIDTISNTINSDSSVETNNSQSSNTSSNESSDFSNDEIKSSLQEYLDLVGALASSPETLLEHLGLYNYADYDSSNRTSDNYIGTNIKYSDYKAKMLNYVTEEWFNTKFENYYKEQDGLLYFADVGASGMEFEVSSISLKGDYSDSAYIAQVYNVHMDDSKELENVEFHIANNNGNCVISYCDY